MIILLLIFLFEMIVLFFLSRRLNQSIFYLFYRFSHSEYFAIAATTLLFFPGTVVHELSHLFVAEILGVRTGKLTLIPKRSGENHIQAGSVEVQKTDPFRRTIIGLAPIFIGITVITLLSIQLTRMFPEVGCQLSVVSCQKTPTTHNPQLTTILFFLFGYLLFTISNNMFSSKEDLNGVTPVLIFLGLILGATYAVGFRLQITGNILTFLENIAQALTKNLGVVLGINIVFLIFFQMILYLVRPRVRR